MLLDRFLCRNAKSRRQQAEGGGRRNELEYLWTRRQTVVERRLRVCACVCLAHMALVSRWALGHVRLRAHANAASK